jgi:carbonic anhydrase
MINRRNMIALLGATGAATLLTPNGKAAPFQHETKHSADESPAISSEEALARLKEGNERFVSGKSKHAHESTEFRHQLVSGQHPFATILGCSDSRVPDELVFDQGFGDLFVIRVAGNVITDDVIGSIEYAQIHLKSPLLVILGHEGCGAVTAALQARQHDSSDPHGVQTIVKLIEPAIRSVDSSLPLPQQVHQGVELNVRWAEAELKKTPETQNLPLHTVGAVYELETGTVRWLS